MLICFQEIEKYKLGNPKSFHYLNQSNCYELVGVSDAHDYLATRRAMDIVGISEKEQVYVKLCLLHIFNFFITLNWEKCSLSLSPPPSPSLSLPHSLQEAIFRVVASILHIGNIEFTKGKEVDSSVPKDDKAKFHLKMTAELLMYEWSPTHIYVLTFDIFLYTL